MTSLEQAINFRDPVIFPRPFGGSKKVDPPLASILYTVGVLEPRIREHIYIYTHKDMYTHMYIYICVYVYIHTYIYMYTLLKPYYTILYHTIPYHAIHYCRITIILVIVGIVIIIDVCYDYCYFSLLLL